MLHHKSWRMKPNWLKKLFNERFPHHTALRKHLDQDFRNNLGSKDNVNCLFYFAIFDKVQFIG